ncbi:RcnB family protein [Pseudomonas typographi]|uniref:RcnB family protein n=1 Tax=Pseudomonas typographi TaxID=2715964 RepID=A0ABR7Z183_9PSED|nr:RcnB family protein [Pseudomonas typographi]MBD1551750.1 RcnB family protein [Pseudomonas typographi]MBD1586995.1 RcnB family protein [Pseudomonas typographi]MBD1599235.1 RcnB family protein [Pseudomonas typographi]
MDTKALLACLVFLGCLSDASLIAQAAEDIQAQALIRDELKVGDAAPDKYTRSDTQLSDWQQRGLKQPPAGTQWVQFGGKYVLVNRASSTIEQIEPGVN